MANVVNIHTLEYRRSVNTPDYRDGNWLINPKLPDCEPKYWKIVGEVLEDMTVEEMSAAEKEAVDLAEQDAAARNNRIGEVEADMTIITRRNAIDQMIADGDITQVEAEDLFPELFAGGG